jgi:hypothetical protein
MLKLVQLFISIALFRKGPQDVPYSIFLLVLFFTINFSVEIFNHLVASGEENDIEFLVFLRYMIISNAVFIAAVYFIFRFHGYSKRFLQCLTTMYGIDLLVVIVFTILNLLALLTGDKQVVPILSLLLLFAVFIWYLFAYMHIFRHGLSVSPLYAGMLSLALFALGITLNSLLLPGKVA